MKKQIAGQLKRTDLILTRRIYQENKELYIGGLWHIQCIDDHCSLINEIWRCTDERLCDSWTFLVGPSNLSGFWQNSQNFLIYLRVVSIFQLCRPFFKTQALVIVDWRPWFTSATSMNHMYTYIATYHLSTDGKFCLPSFFYQGQHNALIWVKLLLLLTVINLTTMSMFSLEHSRYKR